MLWPKLANDLKRAGHGCTSDMPSDEGSFVGMGPFNPQRGLLLRLKFASKSKGFFSEPSLKTLDLYVWSVNESSGEEETGSQLDGEPFPLNFMLP